MEEIAFCNGGEALALINKIIKFLAVIYAKRREETNIKRL
jgi:hypothetical protein